MVAIMRKQYGTVSPADYTIQQPAEGGWLMLYKRRMLALQAFLWQLVMVPHPHVLYTLSLSFPQLLWQRVGIVLLETRTLA